MSTERSEWRHLSTRSTKKYLTNKSFLYLRRKKNMTTKEAFTKLMNTPSWHRLFEITARQSSTIKQAFKNNSVNEDKQKQMLQQIGGVFECTWTYNEKTFNSTPEAFAYLVAQPQWYKLASITYVLAYNTMKQYNKDKFKESSMKKYLLAAGFAVDEHWELPAVIQMRTYNTNQAFEKLINKKQWYKLCGLSAQKGATYQFDYRNKTISIDSMVNLLKLSGATCEIAVKAPDKTTHTTCEEAFMYVIKNTILYDWLDYDKKHLTILKNSYNNNHISLKMIHKILEEAGCTVKYSWTLPVEIM